MKQCEWISQVQAEEIALWGSEAIHLQQASQNGALIVPGFVVSTEIYAHFFNQVPLKKAIKAASKGLSIKNHSHFAGVAKDIRKSIQLADFPKEIKSGLDIYRKELFKRLLKDSKKGLRLTFRMGESSLSQIIHSSGELEKAIKQVYSLQFTDQDLYSRLEQKQAIVPAVSPVIVEYMETPEYSGFVTLHDPSTHDDTVIEISSWHLQKPSKFDSTIQTTFRIDKKSLLLLSRENNKQLWTEDGYGKFVSPLHLGKSEQALTDDQAIQLARTAIQAQKSFKETMTLGWVYGHNRFWINAVNLLSCECQSSEQQKIGLPEGVRVGIPASLGKVTGIVRVIRNNADFSKIAYGDVVITQHLHKAAKDHLHRASAVVFEVGSSISKESEMAKKLGLAAVSGVHRATTDFKSGQLVTVDGIRGIVHSGKISVGNPDIQLLTGTKVAATILDPYSNYHPQIKLADAIGLLRSEFILQMIGAHPQDIIQKKAHAEYSSILAEGIAKLAKQMYPHPVVYQLHDVSTMDLLGLSGRSRQRHEPNPRLGYRGAQRLLAEPEVLDLEIDALNTLYKLGLTNIAIMIPMARSIEEVQDVMKYLHSNLLASQPEVEVWVKVETPGMLSSIEKLCEEDIAGICFDVPALAQLILGFDRDNHQVAHKVDTTNTSVVQALSKAITICEEQGVITNIVAEAEDIRPEVVQAAVQAGVSMVSVAPEQIEGMRLLIGAIEDQIVQEKLVTVEG